MTEIRSEYDFDGPKVMQGRSFQRVQELRNRWVLKPELAERFPDEESVNAALEEYVRLECQST